MSTAQVAFLSSYSINDEINSTLTKINLFTGPLPIVLQFCGHRHRSMLKTISFCVKEQIQEEQFSYQLLSLKWAGLCTSKRYSSSLNCFLAFSYVGVWAEHLFQTLLPKQLSRLLLIIKVQALDFSTYSIAW